MADTANVDPAIAIVVGRDLDIPIQDLQLLVRRPSEDRRSKRVSRARAVDSDVGSMVTIEIGRHGNIPTRHAAPVGLGHAAIGRPKV